MSDSKHAVEKSDGKLARLRKAKGWSQQDLGIRAGIHGVTVSEIERGATDPKVSTLKALAAALGVPLNELLDEESAE